MLQTTAVKGIERRHCTDLGWGRVMRHNPSGALVVDTDSVRSSEELAEGVGFDGEPRFSGAADYLLNRGSDADFGADLLFQRGETPDFGDDDDDGLGADLDEFFGADDDDDFGAARRRKKATTRQRIKKLVQAQKAVQKWGMAVVSGRTTTIAAAAAQTLRIRLQHDFRAEDITFNGSTAGSTISQIMFGDRSVWNVPDGVDVSNFAVTGFLRKLLLGQEIKAGLDIVITCNTAVTGSPAAGHVEAMLTGSKPEA